MGETLPNFTCLSAHCIFYKLRENHEFMTLGKKYSDASGRGERGRGWEEGKERMASVTRRDSQFVTVARRQRWCELRILSLTYFIMHTPSSSSPSSPPPPPRVKVRAIRDLGRLRRASGRPGEPASGPQLHIHSPQTGPFSCGRTRRS